MAFLVTLAQAKAHLNLKSSVTDDELTYFLGVASDLVEEQADRVWRDTTYTERHNGGTDAIVLFHSPVKSVTSVTDDGSLIDPSAYVLTASSGLIRLKTSLFLGGVGEVVVTYVAGSASVPALAQHATLETLRHLWSTQRGTSIRNPLNGDDYAPGTTFSLPQRAVELISKLASHNGIG